MSFHNKQEHPASNADRIERDQSSKSNALVWLAANAIALAALVITACSISLTLFLHWDGPFRDLWEFVDDIERQFNGEWSADYLLEAYGGAHRIFLPKLVFFADYAWLGGRNYLTTAIALLCQFASLWLLGRSIARQTTLPTAEKIIMGSGFLLALFSTSQINNFLYAMDVQWYMSNLAGLVSLRALAQPPSHRSWLLVWLAGTTAALCNFTGLMALPVAALVLLLDAVQAQTPSTQTPSTQKPSTQKQYAYKSLLWLLPIVAVCLWYVTHANNSRQVIFIALERSDSWLTSLYIVLQTLLKMVPYLLKYLASPLSRAWPVFGSALSAAGLLVLFYYWRQHYRNRLSSWQKLCLYLASYIAASAFFTAFGRLIYPNSATTERYQTLVLPWLPALAGLLWPDLRRRPLAPLLLSLWLLLLGWHLLPTQLSSAREMAILSNRVNLAHAAARAGVLEHPYIAATLSHPLIRNKINSVKDNDPFLRSHQLGYFRHLPQFAPGLPLDAGSLPACTGSANMQRNDAAGAWLIEGQLLHDGQTVPDVVVVQDNKIVGLGLLTRPEGFLLPITWQPAADSHFRAFATTASLQPALPVTVTGVRDGIAVCALSPVTPASITQAPITSATTTETETPPNASDASGQ